MLLRSITQHVKTQNWFAVFLDLFIVVVGIFIGMQVTNHYNQGITKQNLANGIDTIIRELNTNKVKLEKDIARLEKSVELDKQNLSNLLTCDAKADSQMKLDNTMIRIMSSYGKTVSNRSTDIVFKTEYTPLLETVFIDQVIAYNVALKEAMTTLYENTLIRNDANVSMFSGLKVHMFSEESAFFLRIRPKIKFDEACKNNHFITQLTIVGTMTYNAHNWLLRLVREIDKMHKFAIKQRELLL